MKRYLPLFAILIWVIVFASCRKPTFIGDELIPASDYLNSERQDTFSIITTDLRDDSAVTSLNLYYSLGSLNSDTFGKTSADIYAQLNLPTNNLFLGDSLTIDSAVLTLDYSGFYGDSTSAQVINVYKMIEDVTPAQYYYSDTRLRTLPIPIGSKSFIANTKDSVDVYGVKYAPHLRIKLSDWFAQELGSDNDSTKFLNDTTFTDFLKGLFIQTDTASGFGNGIMFFDLNASISGVTLYYKNSVADSQAIIFPFNGPSINRFSHNYNASVVYPFLTEPDLPAGDSLLFVQGFTGLKSFVQIPFIDSLQGVSVNKAEIIFTVKGGLGDSTFLPPPALLFIQSDSLKKNYYSYIDYLGETYYSVTDQYFATTSNSYGGTLDTIENRFGDQVYAYRFNVTRHFQNIIDGTIKNNGFMLVVYPGYRIPNAVTLYGSGIDSNSVNAAYKPYLSVTYTHVNK